MNESREYYKDVKSKLDAVGNGFCLAKWTSVTIHLQQGLTHSCYHPKTHKIPLKEIQIDPSALHNTSYKKEQRRLMLDNTRPDECEYCWKVEDLGKGHVSDRVVHSGADWSMPHLEKVLSAGYKANINPRYVEVNFGFECNLKCIYCMPTVSSRWFSEIKKYGNYDISIDHYDVKDEDLNDSRYTDASYANPYVAAFWEWWPDLCKDLHVFRITGGEPLLNDNTFKILDDLIANPRPELELSINSNFSVPDKLFDAFITRINVLLGNKSVKRILVYTSSEGVGEKAEYQRNGLNFEKFERNVRRYLDETGGCALSFMCTFNLLSASSYIEFLKWYESLAKQYPNRVFMDVNEVSYVSFMDMTMIPNEFHINIKECCDFMESSEYFGYIEHNKMLTLHEKAVSSVVSSEDRVVRLRDFHVFISEYDRRNGKSFLKAFPEYERLYEEAKQASGSIIATGGRQNYSPA